MVTIILPGFSITNKVWAEKTKEELDIKFQSKVHYWKHWSTGVKEPGWIENELDTILKSLPNEKINIIAKSIGTLVACLIVKPNPALINKMILCGIPHNDLNEQDKENYMILRNLSPDKILCIQNENDPHGNLSDITRLVFAINKNIKIMPKTSADHEYPYVEDFERFLK